MIVPHELRIGNFVEVENYEIIQLENIHPKGTTKGDEIYLSSMLKPIELSEHWLLKFGFEKMSGNVFRRNDYDVLLTKIESRLIICNYLDLPPSVKLKYVHQLQNLIHSICGEELKIKES